MVHYLNKSIHVHPHKANIPPGWLPPKRDLHVLIPLTGHSTGVRISHVTSYSHRSGLNIFIGLSGRKRSNPWNNVRPPYPSLGRFLSVWLLFYEISPCPLPSAQCPSLHYCQSSPTQQIFTTRPTKP